MYFSKYNIVSEIKDSDSFYIANLLTGNADIIDAQKAAEAGNPLATGGIAAFIVIFIIILVLWNKRKNHTVKKEIFDRQIKAIN